MKRVNTAILGIFLMGYVSIGYAEDYDVVADFGVRTPTSSELIEALNPKIRGIIIHKNTSGSKRPQGIPQEKPRAISMQIQFSYNSAELTLDARKKLDVVAEALRSVELANNKFNIEGHTDSAGSVKYNLKLSQRRAQSVARYISQQYSIESSRLRAIGKGMNQPANPSDPTAPENRRVVIVNAGNL